MGSAKTKGQNVADTTEVPHPTSWFAGCAARANALLVSLDDSQVGPAGVLAKQSLHIWLSKVDSVSSRVRLSAVQGRRPQSDQGSVQMPLMYGVTDRQQD